MLNISNIYIKYYTGMKKLKNLDKFSNTESSCSLKKDHIICHHFPLRSQQAEVLDDDMLGQEFSLEK